MNRPVTIFIDHLSQPSRAVHWFVRLAGIEFNIHEIRLLKGQHRNPEFAAINPMKQVPVLGEEDGFMLSESHAIMQYLCNSRQDLEATRKLYPIPPRHRALVDRFLHWHHNNLRQSASRLFFNTFNASAFGIPVVEGSSEEAARTLRRALKLMDSWLAESKFLAGAEPTIADLSATCELVQLEAMRFNLNDFAAVEHWLSRMKRMQHYAEVHEAWNKVLPKLQAKWDAEAGAAGGGGESSV